MKKSRDDWIRAAWDLQKGLTSQQVADFKKSSRAAKIGAICISGIQENGIIIISRPEDVITVLETYYTELERFVAKQPPKKKRR